MSKPSKAGKWLEPDALMRVEGWARDGLVNEQIAKNMGISERTFYQWCNKYPELVEHLNAGRAPVDFEVENALYRAALGYIQKVKKVLIVNGEPVEVENEIYVQPSVTAMIFWLKNRKPTFWRDSQSLIDQKVKGEESNGLLAEIIEAVRAV